MWLSTPQEPRHTASTAKALCECVCAYVRERGGCRRVSCILGALKSIRVEEFLRQEEEPRKGDPRVGISLAL